MRCVLLAVCAVCLAGVAQADEPDWSGLYIGANAGGLFAGEAETNASSFFNNAPFQFDDLSAFAGGGQIGYDVQTGPWVVGIEGDFQWLDLSETAIGDPTVAGDSIDGELNWFGTVRGRLGYASGHWMPYLTGGLVYGQFAAQYNLAGGGFAEEINYGWTIGGGADIDLGKGWSLRGEYLYLRFPEREITVPNTLLGTYEFDADFHYARSAVNYRF